MKSKTSNQKKLRYRSVAVTVMEVAMDDKVLCGGGSIIPPSTITAAGQEIGTDVDFTSDPTIGDDAGKHFNHEWE